MTRARNSANLASHGNLFVDITNDRTGIGSVVPAQNLHVAGTAGFHADVTFTGDLYNTTWDRSDNSLKFVDNAKVKFGTGGDLEVYHDGTDSVLLNLTGKIRHRSQVHIWKNYHNNQTLAKFSANGAAELYHTNSKKFETTAYGTNTTGTAVNDGLVVAGVATVTTMNVTGVLTYDDVTSVDSVGIVTARQGVRVNADGSSSSNFISVGASADLKLFHQSGHSRISNSTGILKLTAPSGQSVRIVKPDDSANVAVFHIDAETHLYYNGAHKFSTVSDGIQSVGNVTINDSIIHNGDTDTKIRFPTTDTIRFETANTTRVGITTRVAISSHNGTALTFGQLSVRTNGGGDPVCLYLGAFANHPSATGLSTAIMIENQNAQRSEIRFNNNHNGNWHESNGNTQHLRLIWTAPNENSTTPEVCEIKPTVAHIGATGAFSSLRFRTTDNTNGLVTALTLSSGSQHFYVDGSSHFYVNSDGIAMRDKLIHFGDTDTCVRFPANDTVSVETAGSERLRITSNGSVNIGGDYTQTSRKFKVTGNSTFDGGIVFTGTLEGSGFSVNGGNVIMPAFITHDGDSNTKFGFAAADRFTVETAGNERLRIDENGKIIVATGTLHSTRVLARFGIDCHGMNIYDNVGVVANYGMAFYNDPNTNYANGIGFFNDDGQTCGGYIVHQDKGGSNVGDIIMATAATANTPVERLRIKSNGYIGINNSNPSYMIHVDGSGNNGGVRIENSHTTTTVSGNTAAGAFPHNLILSNYGGSGNADDRLVSIGFDVPTTSSHANAVIAYQATGSNGVGDLQFWLENGNVIYERARFTAAGQFLMGTTSSTGARAIIQQNSNDTNPLDQQTCADSSGMRLQNYSFGVGRYTALSLECANASSVQSASIIAQSTSSGTSPDIIIAQRTSNTANSERLRINKNGRVGINSTSPAHHLDVFGNIRSHQQTPSLYLQTTATTAQSAIIRFGDAGSFQVGSIQYEFSGDNHLRFKMGGLGNNVERLTLKGTNGYLGINDNNPANTLVVRESTDNNPAIAMYRQSTGGDIAAIIWKSAAGNQAMINYRGGGGSVGMQFYVGGTSGGAERARLQASNFKEIIFPQQNESTYASRVYFTEVLANAQTYVKFATVTGPSFRTHIKMSCTSTISNVVTNAEFDIVVGHYQDIFVTSRSLDYTQTAIKIISDANQNYDLYIRRSGGANGSSSSNHKIAIHPQLFEQVTFNSTVNYSSVTHEHGTHAGTLRLTATGGPNANIHAQGSITGSSKNFSIPHPLSSLTSTKKLVHASIEGPQLDLIYRGKVTLSSGSATVNIDTVSGMSDGTFVALNRDVQCFTTNETGWSAVKGSVSGNLLTITAQDSSSTDTISWMVVGERQDDTIKSSNITDDSGNLIVEKSLEEDYDTSHKHSSYPT